MKGFLRYHGSIDRSIRDLVRYVPDDKVDFAPRPDAWGFRQIFVHIAKARHLWLDLVGADGVTSDVSPDVTKDEIVRLIVASWDRLAMFASDPMKVEADYVLEGRGTVRGCDLVYSRLTHDVHHRAEILFGLRELGLPAHEIEGFERYGPQPDPLASQ